MTVAELIAALEALPDEAKGLPVKRADEFLDDVTGPLVITDDGETYVLMQ